MTYAVLVSEDGGPERPGCLVLEADALTFDGRRVRYADLGDVYVERSSGGPHPGRPSLVLERRRAGESLRITSLEGLGALHELAERVAAARSAKTAA